MYVVKTVSRLRLFDTLKWIVTVQITSKAKADSDESDDDVLLDSSADTPKEVTKPDVVEEEKRPRQEKKPEVE